MHFVFFGNETVRNAGVRYRAVKFAERLRGEGHRCTLCLPSTVGLWRALYCNRPRPLKALYLLAVLLTRLAQLRHVLSADAVLVKGPLFPYGPPLLERMLRLLNPRILFDVDDAMWEPPAFVRSPFLGAVDYGWARKMTRIARHAIAGNATIADYLRGCGGCGVTIIPTCIDMDRHTLKTYSDRRPGAPVVLGWTGIRDNLGYLDAVHGALRELAQTRNIELTVVSDGEYHPDGVPTRNVPWTPENEIAVLQEADIGLMPLVDTPRARGKCAFKALQFMGVGTPVVLSPVGMNAEVIEPGVSGFSASTSEEWSDALQQLIDDSARRGRMGRAARERVANRYSFDAHLPRFRAVLEAVAREQEPNPPCA
jgi:glycosyltransferase involved in cell wall biosynthesis